MRVCEQVFWSNVDVVMEKERNSYDTTPSLEQQQKQRAAAAAVSTQQNENTWDRE